MVCICESVEQLEFICDFFRNEENANFTVAIFTDVDTKYPDENLRKECQLISSKGLYIYDFLQEITTYILISKPEKSIIISDLPVDFQTRIKKFKINGADFNKDVILRVESAYS